MLNKPKRHLLLQRYRWWKVSVSVVPTAGGKKQNNSSDCFNDSQGCHDAEAHCKMVVNAASKRGTSCRNALDPRGVFHCQQE